MLRLLPLLLVLACKPAPTPAEASLKEGIVTFEAGDHDGALEVLRAAPTSTPQEQANIQTAMGNVLAAQGKIEEAREHHLRAVDLDPKNHAAWVNLGISQRRLGDYAGASDSYDRAEALAPDYAKVHASRGALRILEGRPKEAEIALRKATELDPDLAVAHANLAVALSEQGRDVAAELALEEAVAKGYEHAQYVRGRISGSGGGRGPVP